MELAIETGAARLMRRCIDGVALGLLEMRGSLREHRAAQRRHTDLRRTARAMAHLSDHMRRDIGLPTGGFVGLM